VTSRLLRLYEVAEARRERFHVDLDARPELRLASLDGLLDLLLGRRVGGDGQEALHRLDALVAAAAPRARVLGDVLRAAVEPLVLAEPVVDQARHVLADGHLVRVLAVLRDAEQEHLHHHIVDLRELLLGRLVRLAVALAHDLRHRLEDRFTLSDRHTVYLSTACYVVSVTTTFTVLAKLYCSRYNRVGLYFMVELRLRFLRL